MTCEKEPLQRRVSDNDAITLQNKSKAKKNITRRRNSCTVLPRRRVVNWDFKGERGEEVEIPANSGKP